jgi:Fic family protein
MFLAWFNSPPGKDASDPVIKAFIGHLWWMTLRPFMQGNAVIAFLLTQILLARTEGSAERFYSPAAQILHERAAYESGLERTQKSSTDITAWLLWTLGCFMRAVQAAQHSLQDLLVQSVERAEIIQALNHRQKGMVEYLQENGLAITTTLWAARAECSQDSAYRDILDLIAKGVLRKEAGGGRSTRYSLVAP